MRIALFLIAILVSACTVAPRDTTTAPSTAGVAASPTTEPTTAPTGAPTATPYQGPTASVQDPKVAVATLPFPIIKSLALKTAAVDAEAETNARIGIERYLDALNRFRDSGHTDRSQLFLSGRFGDAVAAGMIASATPGVKRKFELGSFRIDRLLVKPWGVRAVAEVTATIFDKAVDGSAEDQVETGRLRMLGDRLWVEDGWDEANGRWFNGPQAASPESVRNDVATTIAFLLRVESWIPGSALETSFGAGAESPYLKARNQYLNSLDRTKTPSRTFADITASIEKYETFNEIRDGLATVRVNGTVLTMDATGRSSRDPFERRVLILFGNWMPEVVDEELVPGRWLSGGDLALHVRDHNFA